MLATVIPPTTAPSGARQVDPSRGSANSDVARQWVSRPADQRFTSLTDLAAHVRAVRDRSAEAVVPVKQIEFIAPELRAPEDMHQLTVGLPDGATAGPTHWSFNQLAALAKAPAAYLRTLPSQLAADALTYGFRVNREVSEIKTYTSQGLIRAATGPSYGRIFDVEVVDALMEVAGTGAGEARWKVPGVMDWATRIYDPNAPVTKDTTTLFASDRDFFAFLVDDRNPVEIGKLANGAPDLVFRGFYVTNSEVGSSALKLAAFYLRSVCCNRILWGVEHFEELTIRHTALAPSRFMDEARPALNSFAESATARLREGVEKAKAARLAATRDEAMAFLAARRFSAKRAAAIMALDAEAGAQREDGDFPRTAWDFAQSITAFAQTIPHTDERLEIERVAGSLLDKVAA